jgi:hypothetical protein
MKLHELIHKYQWWEILDKVVELYGEENADEYGAAIQEIQNMLPLESRAYIVVQEEREDLYDIGHSTLYYDVSGVVEDDETRELIAMEFEDWGVWLGSDIAKETLETLDEIEILAHVVWEMTFCGFSNAEVKGELAELQRRYDEVSKPGWVGTSMEEIIEKWDKEHPDEQAH